MSHKIQRQGAPPVHGGKFQSNRGEDRRRTLPLAKTSSQAVCHFLKYLGCPAFFLSARVVVVLEPVRPNSSGEMNRCLGDEGGTILNGWSNAEAIRCVRSRSQFAGVFVSDLAYGRQRA
ncbi:hypothetical protein V1477_002970 [Vespula maculifrons]|uniref:Uncharacterized protein n=1 Tax=Vespula maculifrons TaxID=7453 RepID=A0ABD2CUS8_VESMC